jgi:hypothetical protein
MLRSNKTWHGRISGAVEQTLEMGGDGRDTRRRQRLLPADHAVVGRVDGNGDPPKIDINALVHYE